MIPDNKTLNWNGMIQRQFPRAWAKIYKESYYKVEIEPLPSGSEWPLNQSHASFIFLTKDCDGRNCGKNCIIGITILVDDHDKSLMTFPISVAYKVEKVSDETGVVQFRANFSYTINILLQPGINHIGWVAHAPVHYQKGIGFSDRFPVIHFPGLANSCYYNYDLNSDGIYERSLGTVPVLQFMGFENEVPGSISFYNPTGKMMTLKQLAMIKTGPVQFEFGLPLLLSILKSITRDPDSPEWEIKDLLLTKGQYTAHAYHSRHWLYLSFP